MRRKELVTAFVSILVLGAFLAVCTMPTVAGAASPAKKKITLRIVYEQPITDNGHSLYKIWQERVNAAAPERLHIEYLGAYEVIPTFEQMEAVMRGTVEMAVVAPTFYSGLLPDSMAIQCMGAAATVPEVRKSGMIELMDKMHRAKLGVTFLGGGLWAGCLNMILLKEPVYKADLTGLKIRAIPVQQPAVKSLGGTITLVPPEEVYTALERGLLDGVACPTVLTPDYKYEEITKYMFFPLIPMSCWVPVVVNAKVWDGLPEDVKKIIRDELDKLEPEVDPFFGKMEQDIVDNFLKMGLQKCGPTSEAEAKAAVNKQRKAQWKAFIEDRADPAYLGQLNAIAKPVLGLD